MPNHKNGNSQIRARLHLLDFQTMFKEIPSCKREGFLNDYVEYVTQWVPERYRTNIVHHLKRRYKALSFVPLP